jgi:hypothetical protein
MPPVFQTRPRAQHLRLAAAQAESAQAEVTLGPAHPLVAVLRSSQAVAEQAVAVGAVLAADLLVVLEHAPLGLSLTLPLAIALACAAAQTALGLRFAHLAWRRRAICRQLIVDGRARLPLPAIDCELRRLGTARCQTALAEAINGLTDEAMDPRSVPIFRPLIINVAVVRALAAELRELARLLQSGDVDARGVACVESLLVSGASPLYGFEVGPLRDELGRARYFLIGSPLPLGRKERQVMVEGHGDPASRDLKIGFGVLGTCAAVAIILGIVFSL